MDLGELLKCGQMTYFRLGYTFEKALKLSLGGFEMCWNHVHVYSVFSIFWGDIVNNEGNVLCIRVERACVLVGMWQHVLIDMRACLVFVCLIFLLPLLCHIPNSRDFEGTSKGMYMFTPSYFTFKFNNETSFQIIHSSVLFNNQLRTVTGDCSLLFTGLVV
jgi:hypothetical protein